MIPDDLSSEVQREMEYGFTIYGSYASWHEAYAVIREELDELWDAIKRNDPRNMREEALQVAATAMRVCVEYDAQCGATRRRPKHT